MAKKESTADKILKYTALLGLGAATAWGIHKGLEHIKGEGGGGGGKEGEGGTGGSSHPHAVAGHGVALSLLEKGLGHNIIYDDGKLIVNHEGEPHEVRKKAGALAYVSGHILKKITNSDEFQKKFKHYRELHGDTTKALKSALTDILEAKDGETFDKDTLGDLFKFIETTAPYRITKVESEEGKKEAKPIFDEDLHKFFNEGKEFELNDLEEKLGIKKDVIKNLLGKEENELPQKIKWSTLKSVIQTKLSRKDTSQHGAAALRALLQGTGLHKHIENATETITKFIHPDNLPEIVDEEDHAHIYNIMRHTLEHTYNYAKRALTSPLITHEGKDKVTLGEPIIREAKVEPYDWSTALQKAKRHSRRKAASEETTKPVQKKKASTENWLDELSVLVEIRKKASEDPISLADQILAEIEEITEFLK